MANEKYIKQLTIGENTYTIPIPTKNSQLTNDSNFATTSYVDNAIANLPEPMIFKGSLGTGGTITTLPVASASNEGFTYKVITTGTYASQEAKVGDTFISDGSNWVLIPSGDEPSGTVTSVGIANGGGLSISGSPITSSGSITISHADTSTQDSSSNSGRTYIQSITLDGYGHVTGISTATETVTNTDQKIKLTTQATSGSYPIIFGPTSITSNSTYQGYYNTGITVNPSTKTITATTFVGSLTGTASGNLTSASTLDATKLSGTIPADCYTDSNTTYTLTNALSSHKFTWTLTAGGSGSGSTTTTLELVAGTGITLSDNANSKQITITNSGVTGSGNSGQLVQWNGAHTVTDGPKITTSSSAPSGGTNGDIWFTYTA